MNRIGMRRFLLSLAAAALLVSAAAPAFAQPAEPFLRDLPPGISIRRTTVADPAQRAAIGRNLGGGIERLTNTDLEVQGRAIRVNAITGADDASAEAIAASIAKMKPPPFYLRTSRTVIEYVGDGIDAALARKTSFELGFVPKPDRARYRIVAEIATIDSGDAMAMNPLFNAFLALGPNPDPANAARVAELAGRLRFGRSLVLRDPRFGGRPGALRLEPAPVGEEKAGGPAVRYEFEGLPARHGVPFVTVTLEVPVEGTGFVADADAPAASCLAATPSFPADDPKFVALAREITAKATTADEKVAAILAWLSPGRNVKYAGETGSRWGAAKVLEQRFGHCFDFADVFVTLCRASSVPCREVAGWLYGTSGHVWAEYHRAGAGWQQVDPTGGGVLPCGLYHVPYFTTETGEMPVVYLSMPKIEMLGAGE